MYKKIITAVDGGFAAESAAKYAILLAKHCDAELIALFLITKDQTDEDTVRGMRSVERVVEWGKVEGIHVEGVAEHGPVVQSIKSIAEIENVDLVVSSARHEDRKHRFFVRSISQKLMASLSCSVLVVRVTHPGKAMHLSRVLVPIRKGAYSDAERAYLTSKLVARNGKATVLRIEKMTGSRSLLMSDAEKHRIREGERRELKPFIDLLSGYNVSPEISVKFAPKPMEAVLKKAASGHFDLVLLGATKQDIVRDIARGNPIEEVLKMTPCDVIVWHPSRHFNAEQ
ncbi:MAG: universal stress protein [Methanosarcinaceae archaeon]|nr:universal stress protein [Methanosarcinaceae archaeon]